MSTANMSQLTRSSSTPRSFQRSIHVSDIMDGKIVSTRVVMIRFVESEASVPLITGKVNVAMGDSEEYILTDTVGNEIVESEGTTGSLYWKPNARKIHAVESSAFRQWRRRSSRSRNEVSEVHTLSNKVGELLDASQGLEEVTRKISDIVAASHDLVVPRPEVKQAFSCLICRETMTGPMFSSCCRSIVGCRLCVEEWRITSPQCLKCRDQEPVYTQVAGLSAALDALRALP
ncbi:uncharacterized protein LOC117472986 [Trematomus bernacchii]|uniref:uncharacterized protein LOC117472986 n=1 Tax=Trematomus bernacchii TaxID=40690 RepID=UPI00146CF248|nr:uncharacterized protein LOC117472986 [Trematomus bernacchii]